MVYYIYIGNKEGVVKMDAYKATLLNEHETCLQEDYNVTVNEIKDMLKYWSKYLKNITLKVSVGNNEVSKEWYVENGFAKE